MGRRIDINRAYLQGAEAQRGRMEKGGDGKQRRRQWTGRRQNPRIVKTRKREEGKVWGKKRGVPLKGSHLGGVRQKRPTIAGQYEGREPDSTIREYKNSVIWTGGSQMKKK